MKKLVVDESTIASFWKAEGLCLLEYCSPVYSVALTKQQFVANCPLFGLKDDLSARRLQLAQKFAKRTAEKSCHMDLFERLDDPHETRDVSTTIPDTTPEWRDLLLTFL